MDDKDRLATESLEASVREALLWLHNDGKPRHYLHTCIGPPGEFRIGSETMAELEKRGFVHEPVYGMLGAMVLTFAGIAEAERLAYPGKAVAR